jgi:competence protein ComEC
LPEVIPDDKRFYSPFQGFLPFFWLAAAFLGGILLADRVNFPAWMWGSLFGLILLLILGSVFIPKSSKVYYRLRDWLGMNRRLPGAVLAAVFCLGGARYALSLPAVTPFHIAYYNDRGPVQMTGCVVRPPDRRDTATYLTVAVESLRPTESAAVVTPDQVAGRLLVQVPPDGGPWAYGDCLEITGVLQTPQENSDFSYRDYLARQGVLSVSAYARVSRLESGGGNPILGWIYHLGDRAQDTLTHLFPAPESDLLAGILLGRDQGLAPDLQAAFRRTGTTHIIAISGFNIAILSGLFASIFTRLLGRRVGALTAVLAISGYTVLVGADAAVVRAAIMGALGVFGGMFGRRQNGLNSLGIAALGMAAINPQIPWDVGFQLSAAATLGLVLYAQPLSEGFIRLIAKWRPAMPAEQVEKLAGPVGEFFLFTLAAQVMTLPVMAYHFGDVSWLALLANPFILPPQPLVMILGGLSALAGLVLPGLGRIFAVLTLPFVSYTIRMVQWLGRLPVGGLVLPAFHPMWLVVVYALLFFFTLLPREKQRAGLQRVFSLQTGLILLSGLVILTWNRILTAPDGRLHLTLLDESGTVFLRTPDGQTVLIGAGPRPSVLNQFLGQTLPLARRELDMVVVASPDREDLNALTGALSRFPPTQCLWGVDPEANQTAVQVYHALDEMAVPLIPLTAGSALDLGDGIRMTVVWQGPRGAVLWLSWADFSALIPAGQVAGFDWRLPESPDAILLPDGLLDQDGLPAAITVWRPGVILAPIGPGDLPLSGDPPVMTALAGYPLVSTLDHGWVRVSTDGAQMWVSGAP